MDFNELMFLKTLHDDWNAAGVNLWPISRTIRSSAFVDGGKLKALSVNMHVELERGAKELSDIIDKFCNRYNIPETKSNPEKLEEISKKFEAYEDELAIQRISNNPEYTKNFDKARRSNWGEHGVRYAPITSLINSVKGVIKTCDSSISFTNAVYKVDSVNDPRYDKTTSQKVLENFKPNDGVLFDYNFDYDQIEKFAKDNNIDMGTPEYAKLIVKRIRAFKQDLISTTNKYFGKNSRFADLNIMDLVL